MWRVYNIVQGFLAYALVFMLGMLSMLIITVFAYLNKMI